MHVFKREYEYAMKWVSKREEQYAEGVQEGVGMNHGIGIPTPIAGIPTHPLY